LPIESAKQLFKISRIACASIFRFWMIIDTVRLLQGAVRAGSLLLEGFLPVIVVFFALNSSPPAHQCWREAVLGVRVVFVVGAVGY
jgi:hypothetical protein